MNIIARTMLGLSLCAASLTPYAAGDAKHYPGVFLGATHFDGESDFTFGVEYEYMFDKHFGAGLIWERTAEGHDGDGVNVVIAEVFYHPNHHWRFGIGFGEEQIRGKKPKEKDLWRLSATYEYPVGQFVVAPTVAVDFIDGDRATVAGLAILWPF